MKTCRDCGRAGTRSFEWARGRGWVCVRFLACCDRQDRRRNQRKRRS